MEKLKLRLFGQCFCYPTIGYATAHVVEYRDVEFARSFVKLGWDVSVVSDGNYSGMSTGGYMLEQSVSYDDDAIFLVDVTGFRNAKKRLDLSKYRALGFPVGCYIDNSYYEDGMDMVSDWGSPSPALAQYYQQTYMTHSFMGTWGTPIVPDQPDPYEGDSKLPRAIYGGILFPRAIEYMNELAERGNVEVWHCGLWQADGECRGFTDDERKNLLHPRIHCATDIDGLYQGQHGPVIFGDHFKYLQHADVGMALNTMAPRDTVICKLYDYLGCGLPVVCDDGFPNCHDPELLCAGECVPYLDKDAFIEAVERTASIYHNRDIIKGKARMLGTWFDVAVRFDWAFRRAHD